ncbi:uncharacterized protein LOC133856727 [Alnus glutinosa]|uniref:uncharacterized protein LOC133856727 n=1 Tax=Alnus glutinosa TaxID=3517 RepID=UPI002D77DC63|nr:uncharacterized protein LOC133856727 [Alnus glutinosa]
MVHTATIVEQGIKEATADYVNRKQSMSIGASPPPAPSKRVLYRFARRCPMAVTRSQGTQASNYQPRQPTQARVYSLTLGNVEIDDNATDVVTGATHSFISSTFVMLYKLSTEPLEKKICEAIPVGSAVTCRKCVDNCHIVIEGKTLPAKFAVFSMLGFDVILRMHCLSKYKDNIDCRKKEVTFRLNGIKEFKFCGSHIRATLPLLYVVQAIKKVTGLPPDQEIEFTIDLVPETQPIYKALCDMVPIELYL